MKKVLLASSATLVVAALAVPASAAEKITLSLGGYMEQYIGFADNEKDAGVAEYRSFDVQSDTEVWFLGSTTLDNGIKVAVKVEMEADGEDTNGQIDESWLELSSATMGVLRFGYDDAVTSQFHNVAPNYGPSFDDADTWVVNRGIVNQTDSYILLGQGDEAKISFITPRFSGLQAGLTYVPQLENARGSGNGSNSDGMPNAVGGGGDAWFVGLNYTREIGALGLNADYGYGRASGGVKDGTAAIAGDAANIRTADGHQIGLLLTYGAFEFGGGWAYSNEVHGDLSAGNFASNEGSVWEVGLGYKPGPWGVSISYLRSEQTGDLGVPGEDEANITALSGIYNLGPGIDVHGSLYFVDYDSETPNNDVNFNDGGWAVVGGLVLSF